MGVKVKRKYGENIDFMRLARVFLNRLFTLVARSIFAFAGPGSRPILRSSILLDRHDAASLSQMWALYR
jgi:hypothetical protein